MIPFFRSTHSERRNEVDFEKFATCVELMANGRHLTPAGLIDIAEIAADDEPEETQT